MEMLMTMMVKGGRRAGLVPTTFRSVTETQFDVGLTDAELEVDAVLDDDGDEEYSEVTTGAVLGIVHKRDGESFHWLRADIDCEMTVDRLGRAVANIVSDALTVDEWVEMRSRNAAAKGQGPCHSGDFLGMDGVVERALGEFGTVRNPVDHGQATMILAALQWAREHSFTAGRWDWYPVPEGGR